MSSTSVNASGVIATACGCSHVSAELARPARIWQTRSANLLCGGARRIGRSVRKPLIDSGIRQNADHQDHLRLPGMAAMLQAVRTKCFLPRHRSGSPAGQEHRKAGRNSSSTRKREIESITRRKKIFGVPGNRNWASGQSRVLGFVAALAALMAILRVFRDQLCRT